GYIIERKSSFSEDLYLFMSLSGEQDDVARLCGADRALDSSSAVLFDDEWCIGLADAGDDLLDDRGRALAARVVAGDDDEVAGFRSRQAHLLTLGAVAVAATAEEGNDTAAVDTNAVASKRNEIAESIVGVRVVNDDAEACAFRACYDLEAAGNLAQRRSRTCDLFERQAASESGAHGREEVIDIHAAAQWRLNGDRSVGSDEVEAGVTHCEVQVGRKVRRVRRIKSIAHQLNICRWIEHLCGVGIILVDDGDPRRRSTDTRKDLRLRTRVGFHRAVEVEVVLREVGEDRDIYRQAPDTFLFERMRAHLHHGLSAPGLHAFSKNRIDVAAFRSGVVGGTNLSRDVGLDRAEQNALAADAREKLFEEKGRGRLAVGS